LIFDSSAVYRFVNGMWLTLTTGFHASANTVANKCMFCEIVKLSAGESTRVLFDILNISKYLLQCCKIVIINVENCCFYGILSPETTI